MADKTDTRDFEQLMRDWLKKIDPRFKIILISTFLWGFAAHGMTVFNEYAHHDALRYLFDVGETFSSGRWFLGLMAEWSTKLLDSPHFGLPLFNGILSFFFIGLTVWLIVHLFDIRHTFSCIALSGIFVTFPAITALFSYTFTAHYYMIAVFLSAAGAYLICRYRKWYTCLSGALLICCSLGIYQAYLPIALSILLLYLIQNVLTGETWKMKDFLIKALWFGSCCVCALLLYMVLNKVFLIRRQAFLAPYMGISNMGQEGLRTYLVRAKYIYQVMFSPEYLHNKYVESMVLMFPQRTISLYLISMAATILLALYNTWCITRKDVVRAICFLFAVMLLPLANNFIFVMCDPDTAHSLMSYGQVMIFVNLIWLIEHTHFPKIHVSRCICGTALIVLLLLPSIYTRYANACYLQIELEQQQVISYFTTMIAQIKNTEGYKDEYPLVVVNNGQLQDKALQPIPEFEDFILVPSYGIYRILNQGWDIFVKYWCGYAPEMGDPDAFADLPEVEAMPRYPDQGSIRIIGETVVIKF